MKFKWKKFGITLLSVSAPISFAGNVVQHNEITNLTTVVHELTIEQEARIAVPYNGIEGAYITAPASKVDSIKTSLENKKKTQRWKSGRR